MKFEQADFRPSGEGVLVRPFHKKRLLRINPERARELGLDEADLDILGGVLDGNLQKQIAHNLGQPRKTTEYQIQALPRKMISGAQLQQFGSHERTIVFTVAVISGVIEAV